jgi:polar amino acid transport system ATP-binding protein
MGRELLRIEHLHKEFEGKTVLDDLSLTLREGEVAVIVGPSGCGKSTLLRCINALELIQGGSIFLDGEEIHADPRKLPQLRQKVGMVFQSYELFPHKSILDNITLAPRMVQKRGREDAEAEALALLERVGLADRRRTIPGSFPAGRSRRSPSFGRSSCTRRCCSLTR